MERGARAGRHIEAVRRRIERWRWRRLKHEPMPEDLWAAATGLARQHGVSRTARELGVGYQTLRDRVERVPSRPRRRAGRSNGFVEVDTSELFGQHSSMGTEVELRDGDGATLWLRIAAAHSVDVTGVVNAFWRRGRS